MCILAPNPFLVVIGDEHKKDNHEGTGGRIANVGATPQGNQIPPQVKVVVNDQVLVNPPDIMYAEVRASLLQIHQVITTEAQAITTQDTKRLFLE